MRINPQAQPSTPSNRHQRRNEAVWRASESAAAGTTDGQGSAAQGTQYYIKPTPEAVAEVVAALVASAFSSAEFARLFGEQVLPERWSLDEALAVWYSLGHLALVVAAWRAYNNNTKVSRVLDHCRPRLLKDWRSPEGVLDQLRTIVNQTEAEAFACFTKCTAGADLSVPDM